MATFNDVWKIGMGLPEVEETTFYGTAGLKVKGKAFCRIWSEREYERDEITDAFSPPQKVLSSYFNEFIKLEVLNFN